MIFCGLNPAASAAGSGHNFSHRNNRFWTVLQLAGFTDVRLRPQDERRLLEYGCGITAVVGFVDREGDRIFNAAAVIAGCGSSSSSSQSATDSPSVTNATTSSATSVATPKAQAASSNVCPAAGHALDGVYHPARLTVLSACKHATGG